MKNIVYAIIISILINACNPNSNKPSHENTNESAVHYDMKDENNIASHPYIDAVDQYMRGLNESDLSSILFLYADNATVEDPVGSKIVSGMDSLREFYTGAVNIELNVKRTGSVRIAGKEAAFPFELKMSINGVHTVTEIIDVFRFNKEGKIISMRAYHGPINRKQIDSESL